MIRRSQHGLTFYQFESLPADAVRHGFFTRHGGVSRPPFDSLNLGASVGDDPAALAENRRRVFEALDLRDVNVATCYATHGTHIGGIGREDLGKAFPGTDGLITDVPGATLWLRFADCVPVLLFDRRRHAVALVHAGWRGTAGRIASRAVDALREAYGSRPADILAGIGPSIGPCCYQVDAERVGELLALWPDGKDCIAPDGPRRFRLDLWSANARQLRESGVSRIEMSGLCTCCRRDEFFSHRGDGGRTGRFAVFVGLSGERAL